MSSDNVSRDVLMMFKEVEMIKKRFGKDACKTRKHCYSLSINSECFVDYQRKATEIRVLVNDKTDEKRIKQKLPDLIVSDIARGDNYNAGFEMAENFQATRLFQGPYYFYAGDLGHGRIGRAKKIGAVIFTEPKPLLNELREVLAMKGQKIV